MVLEGEGTPHACSHTVMLCQYSLPFRAILASSHGAGPRQAMSAPRSGHCHGVAVGDHCGLLSTNADELQPRESGTVSSVALNAFPTEMDPQLSAHMLSSASSLGGPGVAVVSQPASGRDASRRLGTRATTINHAQGAAFHTLNSFQLGRLTKASR